MRSMLIESLCYSRNYSLSTYRKFSEKPTFLTPITYAYVCVPRGKKY